MVVRNKNLNFNLTEFERLVLFDYLQNVEGNNKSEKLLNALGVEHEGNFPRIAWKLEKSTDCIDGKRRHYIVNFVMSEKEKQAIQKKLGWERRANYRNLIFDVLGLILEYNL